ncbi:MAG TPA: CBS domain-containing protein [Planctomycetaceae bacterium]|nr:CBS domain-containing protein [Planctomycetaceae bacterium]
MKCPDCGHENVAGADECQECGVSLWGLEPQGNEVEQSIAAHAVNVLCPRQPVCVHPETPVRTVIAQMAHQQIGCVLVEESANLLGVFSERDVLNKVSLDPGNLNRPVSEFMTAAPATITKSDSIGFGLQTMDLGGYRHLPVVNSANIAIGIISSRDILRFLAVKYARSRG